MTEPTEARLSNNDRSLTQQKVHAARLSVAAGATLLMAKGGVGFAVGSVAVLSEAAHSGADLLAATVAFFAIRAADVPPDDQHPYGHGKLEAISGVIEAVFVLGAAVFIIVEAVQALRRGHAPSPSIWAVGVMTVSAIVNLLVARHLLQVARRADSVALAADARHLMVDVYTSFGVAAGITLAYLTHLPLLDPLAALVVAGFVLHTAYSITRDALALLVDTRLPDGELQAVERIMEADTDVLSWHKLRTRKSGSERHIDVHIQVSDDMTIVQAHRVTEVLEDKMREALPNVQVVIHTEPYEEEKRHQKNNPL